MASSKSVGLKYGFRSGLEKSVAGDLSAQSIPFTFEEHKLSYEQPAKVRSYTPDFILPNGIIVETKGRFVTADRQKHLMIASQYPLLDIRFVFSNPRNRISKQSKTTYAKWCEKNQFEYAAKTIPTAWLQEELHPDVVNATMDLLDWNPPTPKTKPKRKKRNGKD